MFSKTYTFSPSTTIKSAEVNQNFDDAIDGLNVAAPSGLISLWSGAIVDIPDGWFLCNGANSTPDLRNKFVVGAGDTHAVDAVGGESTHVLSEAEIPVLSHAGHNAQQWFGTRKAVDTTTDDLDAGKNVGFKAATIPNHGSGNAHNNLPPFHALAYIMKS